MIIWEKRMLFEALRKSSLSHLRTVKQITTVGLDMKRWRVDPGAF